MDLQPLIAYFGEPNQEGLVRPEALKRFVYQSPTLMYEILVDLTEKTVAGPTFPPPNTPAQ